MSGNDTACSPYGNCTIIQGAYSNGTYYVTQYNPSAPVPEKWHQDMEMAFICVFNSLSLMTITARIWYRRRKMKRLRGDDIWMAVAAVFLIGYWASQIGTNIYGSGLHMINVPEYWRSMHWHFEFGWAGYYIVTSFIKMSICSSFLQILPAHFRGLRIGVHVMCALIISLMLVECGIWWVGCEPFDSNFVWTILSSRCINYDIFRWLWIGVSVPIDLVLTAIPLQILKRAKLREHERRILKMIFCATLLGTITCCLGIYGVWLIRIAEANDWFYQETAFIMMNDIEIFMYALGASFPVLSRHLVQRANPGPGEAHTNFSSWARYIPNFFPTATTSANDALVELHPSASLQFHKSSEPSFTSGGDRSSMPSTAPSRTNSDAVDINMNLDMGNTDVDVEKGEGGIMKGDLARAETEAPTSGEEEQMGLGEFLRSSNVTGSG